MNIQSLIATMGLVVFMSSTCNAGGVTLALKKSQNLLCSISQDVENIIQDMESICSQDEITVFTDRKGISKRVRALLAPTSPLYAFPHISEDTYTELINTLKVCLENRPEKADVILHTWSYLMGIPVVGLKNGRDYYSSCNHLLPEVSKEEREGIRIDPTRDEFCVRADAYGSYAYGSRHRHIETPIDLCISMLIYRKDHLKDPMVQQISEIQKIAWPLITQELVPLAAFRVKLGSFLRATVLKTVETEQGKPSYSFGLIRLLQNTAIYLSLADEENSGTITSPCSFDTVSYFGLQDGVFIENGLLDSPQVHRPFGTLFFLRGLFEHYPQEFIASTARARWSGPYIRGIYYPHYSFFLLDEEGAQELEEFRTHEDRQGLIEARDKFAAAFINHMQGSENLLTKKLLNYLNLQQLQTVLSTVSSLPNILCNPSFDLDLSSIVDEQSADVERAWTHTELIATVIKHLCCVEFQDCRRINLSHNSLDDADLKALGKVLGYNVLPDLEELDLSHNNITERGLSCLKPLLSRDNFKRLKMSLNQVRTVPASLHERLLDKIIWEDESNQ